MKSVETEGKTTEEAIQKACEELRVSRQDLEVEVLSGGSSGFLGLGAWRNSSVDAVARTGRAPIVSNQREAWSCTLASRLEVFSCISWTFFLSGTGTD